MLMTACNDNFKGPRSQAGHSTGQRPRRADMAMPVALQRVEDYLEEHLRGEINLARLELVAGVSRQKLYDIFNRFHGCSPLTYVRRRRLEEVRQTILNTPQRCRTIANVAMYWGFNHLGRFARDYAKLFGETPSYTLALSKQNKIIKSC